MFLFLSAGTVKVIGSLEVVALIASFADPEWALPINTLLLILLTVLAGRNGGKMKKANEEIARVSTKVDHAAVAAAAAATAAADAARIAKDIGGLARHREIPPEIT